MVLGVPGRAPCCFLQQQEPPGNASWWATCGRAAEPNGPASRWATLWSPSTDTRPGCNGWGTVREGVSLIFLILKSIYISYMEPSTCLRVKTSGNLSGLPSYWGANIGSLGLSRGPAKTEASWGALPGLEGGGDLTEARFGCASGGMTFFFGRVSGLEWWKHLSFGKVTLGGTNLLGEKTRPRFVTFRHSSSFSAGSMDRSRWSSWASLGSGRPSSGWTTRTAGVRLLWWLLFVCLCRCGLSG